MKRILNKRSGSTDWRPILPATEADAQKIENSSPVITCGKDLFIAYQMGRKVNALVTGCMFILSGNSFQQQNKFFVKIGGLVSERAEEFSIEFFYGLYSLFDYF